MLGRSQQAQLAWAVDLTPPPPPSVGGTRGCNADSEADMVQDGVYLAYLCKKTYVNFRQLPLNIAEMFYDWLKKKVQKC